MDHLSLVIVNSLTVTLTSFPFYQKRHFEPQRCHVRSQDRTGCARLRHAVATSVPIKIRNQFRPSALSHVESARYPYSQYKEPTLRINYRAD